MPASFPPPPAPPVGSSVVSSQAPAQRDPSVVSSLKFLRKTPWARDKVEQLYLATRFTE